MPAPNRTELLAFILERFNRNEFEILCNDYFPDFYRNYEGINTPRTNLVEALVAHCERRDQLQRLRSAVHAARPQPYEAMFGEFIATEIQQKQRNPKQAFLAYSHKDEGIARRLATDLRAAGLKVWIAIDSIRAGEVWWDTIYRGLSESGIFIVLLTPNSATSQWVNLEIEVALQENKDGNMRIFPLKMEPCDDRAFPVLLRAFQFALFESDYDAGLSTLFQGLGVEKPTGLTKQLLAWENNQILNFRFSNLTQFPQEVIQSISATNQATKGVNLSQNFLTTLPDNFSDLQGVEWLDLQSNKLTFVPEVIWQLNDLKSLSLQNNQITALSEQILNLPNLQEIFLDNNPIVEPPIEIVSKGLDAIREYYRQRQGNEIAHSYEAKLIIIGEPGSGKTTLSRKLINPESAMPKEEETTRGIDIKRWIFNAPDGNSFRVNIWDFGGQEIYHQTHQFFLTHRSLYVLLADNRKEDTDFYYWLGNTQLLGGDSPIIVISNEKEDRPKEIPQDELKREFVNVKEFFCSNLKTGRELSKIEKEIKHLLGKLPLVGISVPQSWAKVRSILETDKRDYLSKDDFLNICLKTGFVKDEDALQYSEYLHDLGIILHFQDDPVLQEIVILKPTWATHAVYKIVDSPEIIKAKGEFTRQDLKRLWHEVEYKGRHEELIRLMLNFKLCYEIIGRRDRYIMPQFLSDVKPNYEWDDNENAYRRYKYQFMPKGIITKFIVAMHSLIEKQSIVWKRGVVLEKDGARAEIIEHFQNREITIRVSGPTRRELLTIATNELEHVHEGFGDKLKADAYVPCTCSECTSGNKPHYFKAADLLRRVQHRITEVQCELSYLQVNVRQIIEGIPMDQIDAIGLKEFLQEHFDKADLDILCFKFSEKLKILGRARVDLETVGLKDMRKEHLIVLLVEHCQRHGTLTLLNRLARDKHLNIT